MLSKLVDMADVNTYCILMGKRIQEVRDKRDLTQEQVAYQLGLSRNHIGYIENGKRVPSLKTLFRIAEVLEVPVRDFFDFDWPAPETVYEFDSDSIAETAD